MRENIDQIREISGKEVGPRESFNVTLEKMHKVLGEFNIQASDAELLEALRKFREDIAVEEKEGLPS